MTAGNWSGSGPSGRLGLLLHGLLLFLTGYQVLYPTQAWPESAPWVLGAVALTLALVGLVAWGGGNHPTVRLPRVAAVWAGGVLVLIAGMTVQGVLLRWPSSGMDSLASHLLALGVGVGAYGTARLAGRRAITVTAWILILSVPVMALHGLIQRTVLYPAILGELEQSLGQSVDPIDMGILHHLRLGRVASVWGDPNIFALACALGLPPALLVAVGRVRVPPVLRWIAGAAVPAALLGIYLAGSRGGMLDGLAVGLIVGAYLLGTGRKGTRENPRRGVAAVTLVAALILANGFGPRTIPAQQTQAAAPAPSSFWAALQRQDTIRERLHYFAVGSRLVRESPWVGHGPGAVEKFWGRYKPENSREARYLHNWPLMVAVEHGLIGLGCFLAVLVAGFGALVTRVGRAHPLTAALGISALVPWLDGLYQLSFNHRESMVLAGLLLGTTLGSLVPVSGSGPGIWGRLGKGSSRGLILGLGLAILGLAFGGVILPQAVSDRAIRRAETALTENNPTQALAAARQAESLFPSHGAPKQLLASARMALGDPVSALNHLDQAARLEPWRLSIAFQRVDILMKLGQPRKAEVILMEALPYYPTSPRLHRKLAEARQASGNLAGAISAAREAVRHGYLTLKADQDYLAGLESQAPVTAPHNPRSGP